MVAEAAGEFLEPGEELAGVVAAEPSAGLRLYVCAYAKGDSLSWLALDRSGRPIADRALVRDAVSIVALCEVAEESAGGGDVADLQARLVELREAERPDGIEEAERAAAELGEAIVEAPRVASIAYLDAVGAAAAKLERTLGALGSSPFGKAMSAASGSVDELARDVEENYKRPLG